MTTVTPPHLTAANSLAAAMIESSNAPLLLIDGGLKVVAASASFCRAFGIEPASIPDRPLAGLGAGEWNVPQLGSLLEGTLAGHAQIEAYEMDLDRAGRGSRRLVLNARKLDYEDTGNARLLLTVTDVTDARASEKLKDNLLREKAILLQELQHRVANSLQIIASVLMQSARRVQSPETRTYLNDAHNRIMSVAAVQRQLATSSLSDVQLRPYFTELCKSIAASMISDPEQLSLTVHCDDSSANPDKSVSLGLVVTELVINALKHAFPAHRVGSIIVKYQANGPAWTLSVEDDGVGMPTGAFGGKAGLGTSIVEAIAKQLEAQVRITDAAPGTVVSLVHA